MNFQKISHKDVLKDLFFFKFLYKRCDSQLIGTINSFSPYHVRYNIQILND
jgi:hypothetical protein